MDQIEKAKRFSELHVKGTPLVLYNAWDAGSAKSILEAGALAIATSSWAVAEAQGYRDGEAIPVELVEQVAARIVATIDVPVTVDFEGGYSDVDDELAGNVARLLDLGVIGINFEDRVVKGSGLYDIARQAERIAAIRETAEKSGAGRRRGGDGGCCVSRERRGNRSAPALSRASVGPQRDPHPEKRASCARLEGRDRFASWFETARARLLTMLVYPRCFSYAFRCV